MASFLTSSTPVLSGLVLSFIVVSTSLAADPCLNTITWMNGCLHNARSFVFVNGSPTEEFEVFRGLRQIDPTSPFLFRLAMEGLHALTSKVEALGLFKGDSIGRDNMSISHLMCFFLISGLQINIHKSNVLGVGVIDEEVSYMVNIIGCGASKFPMKYLGVPVGCNMARQQPLKEVFPRIYSLDTDKDQHDSWQWSLDMSKGFSVASVRQLVDSHILVTGNEATRWNRSLPIKFNVILWRLKLKLPSRVNLDRRAATRLKVYGPSSLSGGRWIFRFVSILQS
nr:RNA-directed DNA polymerase, eukaryota [Tanacetum cinerariifolium]GEY36738.1 RNA-directed DNA polymerase, eukaryota [Tanacetum cinerariifolium]